MKLTTVEQAERLPGTVWEKHGQQREIVRITDLEKSPYNPRWLGGNVYWKQPSAEREQKRPHWMAYFQEWIMSAVPVNDAAKKLVEEAERL